MNISRFCSVLGACVRGDGDGDDYKNNECNNNKTSNDFDDVAMTVAKKKKFYKKTITAIKLW